MPVGAVLSAIGSVASNMLQNSQNVELAKGQREYDRKMWYEQAAYNSPVNQVQRLRDAGLNPALAMTNGMMDSGTQSQPSGGQQAPVVDFSPIAQGLRDSVDLYQQKRYQDAQISKLNEETTNQAIKNRYENQRQIEELVNLKNSGNLTVSQKRHVDIQIRALQLENEWIDKKNSSQIALNEAQAKKAHQEASYFELLSEGQRLANEFAPKQQAALLKEIAARIKDLQASANAHNSQAAYDTAQKMLTEAQEKGVKIDNDTKDRIADALVDKAFSEAQDAYYTSGTKANRYYYGAAEQFGVKSKDDKFYLQNRYNYMDSHPSKR